MKNIQQDSYLAEWENTLQILQSEIGEYREMEYFIQLGRHYSNMAEQKPRMITLGLDFPEEILQALDNELVYVLGGGFTSAVWAEQMVPRDTDSATKSILGMLTKEEWNLTDKAAVLIPITCDSMRKLSYKLKEEMKVISIEIPSDKSDIMLKEQWKIETKRVIREMEKHLHKRLSRRVLKEQIVDMQEAKEAWKKLEKCRNRKEIHLPGSVMLYLANSYFWSKDKKEWTKHLRSLLKEAKHKRMNRLEGVKPQVLLLGSPIYAPNYKIPFLLEELGIQLEGLVHPMVNHLSREAMKQEDFVRKSNIVDRLTEITLEQNMSPAFVENSVLFSTVKAKLEEEVYDGVVFHVLKGQIEYDFELNRLEQYLEEQNIPVFRLETDYNYQDIEQLRIRLEAFCEMLVHRAEVQRRGA